MKESNVMSCPECEGRGRILAGYRAHRLIWEECARCRGLGEVRIVRIRRKKRKKER